MSQIASTYKGRDVEEWLDRQFYRPIGYLFARVAQAWSLSPNAVTIISIFLGVAAGHLFYYPDLSVNVTGMVLLVWAEVLDSADGQLARMTGSRSRFGRILDGVAGNLMFVSVYFHLAFRMVLQDGQWWALLLAVAAGASHSFQCAVADYYRNAYLYFVYGEERSELDRAPEVQEMYGQLRWSNGPVKKFIYLVYRNYTYQQEWCAQSFLRLREALLKTYGASVIPPAVRTEYAALNKPLLKYYNIITTNTRMIALFSALLLGMPVLYFLLEILVLNAVMLGVSARQGRVNDLLLASITRQTNAEARAC